MSSIRRLIPLAAIVVAAVVSAPAPALGSGGRILYASHGSLLSVPAEGGAPRTIARVPANTLDLAASRDGSRIALISNSRLPYPKTGSVRSIYVLRRGHRLRLVRRFHTTSPLEIAMSPNGRWIAFGQSGEIWLMRADGGDAHQVTEGPSVAWDPAFTPDGQSLVFDRDADTGPRSSPRIFLARIADGAETQLTPEEGRDPSVSSSGLLLYTRPEQGRIDSRLIVMAPDGSGRHTVDRFNDPFYDLRSTFSPDGRSVAYLRLWEKGGHASDYRYSIHTKTVGGRRPRKVVGGIRNGARSVPYPGHGPAGPVWIP